MTPEISIVVPSHDRPIRLLWLLNALMDQTLPRDRWEIVVGHDSSGPLTEEILTEHPLAKEGTLRHVTLEPNTAPPGRNRNAAWRIARAPIIAFTDDDCRPPADWLENALNAARRHPDAIVQGTTMYDRDEDAIRLGTHYHTQRIIPPEPWAQCCNIVYPKRWLEQVGGFKEDTYTGEDTDLAMRCRKEGAEYVAAPEVLTNHAVVELTFRQRLKGLWRWNDLPLLYKRHPELRESLPMWIFWKHTHVWLPPFVVGLVQLQRRGLLWGLLCIPWLVWATPKHGTNPRGRYRNLIEVPGKAALDAMEFAACTYGSVKYRSPLL